jgi:hypothetical protein
LSRKVLKALAPLLAFVAMAAVPAMASAITLTSPVGTTLAVGSPITALSSNLEFTGNNEASKALQCEFNHVAGTVTANPGAVATASITSGSFTRTSTNTECKTTLGGGAVTAHITPLNLPWTVHFRTKDVVEITHVHFTATLTVSGTSVAHCTYTASDPPSNVDTVTGTYATSPNPLSINITNAGFVLDAAESSGECAATGILHGNFAVTSGGNEVRAD